MNIILSTELTDELSNISLQINNLLLHSNSNLRINPLSKSIVLSADIFSKPGLFLLSYSLLRFSDANVLFKDCNILKDSFSFLQNKTKRKVEIFNSSIPKSLRDNIQTVSLIYQVLNYGKLSNSIRNYILYNLSNFKFPHKKETHIFRHLQTSYEISIGTSKDQIKKLLGHLDTNSQNSYIHNELIMYFSQL